MRLPHPQWLHHETKDCTSYLKTVVSIFSCHSNESVDERLEFFRKVLLIRETRGMKDFRKPAIHIHCEHIVRGTIIFLLWKPFCQSNEDDDEKQVFILVILIHWGSHINLVMHKVSLFGKHGQSIYMTNNFLFVTKTNWKAGKPSSWSSPTFSTTTLLSSEITRTHNKTPGR